MSKLAENQRVRIKKVTLEDYYGLEKFIVIVLEQKGKILWKQLEHERLPENFGYDCTDEVKDMLINSLLLKHENSLLYQNMKDKQKIKMKKFIKCIKNRD